MSKYNRNQNKQGQGHDQNQRQPKTNAPIDTLRDGALKVAIFKNERENGVNFSMQPARIYTDNDGRVRETPNLSGAEPLRMANLLNKSYDRVGEFKQALKEQGQNNTRER